MMESNIRDFIKFVSNKSILITSHISTDIDGFASAFVLKFFFTSFYPDNRCFLYLPQLSKHTKQFIEKILSQFQDFNFKSETVKDLSNIDLIVILDTNNLDQVELPPSIDAAGLKIPVVFIDHHVELHREYPMVLDRLNLVYEDYSSTSEIIYEICKQSNLHLNKLQKHLLTAAILTDSGRFKHGNNSTIHNVSELVGDDLNFQDVILDLKYEKDLSEKIATIKAVQRVKIIKENEWLIGVSNVSSFEARAARSLISIGFDVGIVYSEKKSKFRISSRANEKVCTKTNLHLGKILDHLSKEFNASGGGHDGAASLNGKEGLTLILDEFLGEIKAILSQ
ncbi:MAG: hypothetical protein GF383_06845 [Candidatus Lokiarchaeota archaeon]|nr:hypothetical protein [Candidatus Lokiarchaeota archaeon]MBD3339839.1 hypothetical protein [Candidatus Lokiarchaeota archaeon]